MSDNKADRGPADRARINVQEDYEVQYWSKEFGISPAKLKELVATHGVMAADVRRAAGK